MTSTELSYEAGGRRFVGQLAVPARVPAGGAAGVLVLHEAPGVSPHVIRVADRLAELGYVALAADYIGDGRVLEGAEMTSMLGTFGRDPDQMRAVGLAGLDALRATGHVNPGRLAAIGYCFGGTMAIELARSGTDLKAVMGFHSGLASHRPEDSKNIVGSVIAYIGADDPYVPPDQRQAFIAEMTAAGVDWSLMLHGGVVHSFTNPDFDGNATPGIRYDERADRRSWAVMRELFAETIDQEV